MFIVHIFTDSLGVANGSTVWSNQQAQTRFHIQDCSLWGLPHWEYTTALIYYIEVSHDSAHSKGPMEKAHFNAIANQLAHIY